MSVSSRPDAPAGPCTTVVHLQASSRDVQVMELEKASKRIQMFFLEYLGRCIAEVMRPVQTARGMVAAAPSSKPYYLVLLGIGATLGAPLAGRSRQTRWSRPRVIVRVAIRVKLTDRPWLAGRSLSM